MRSKEYGAIEMLSFNPLQFYNTWWATSSAPLAPVVAEGIKWSYAEPNRFLESIFRIHQETTELKSRSIPHLHYDFYYDCVTRHLGKCRIALKVIEGEAHSTEWTFEQLHGYVNDQLVKWQTASIQRGQKIALVMPMGIHFLVSLLTALKLGLAFTFLPIDSQFLTAKQSQKWLEDLEVDHVITTSISVQFVNEHASVFMMGNLEEKQNLASDSYLYPAEEIVQQSLACYTQNAMAMVPLTAHEVYCHALRDGILSLNLKPGISWAYPFSCALKEQPCQLLMSMLCGATTVYAAEKDLLKNPQLLMQEPLHILGISLALKELWEKNLGFPITPLQFWYRSPLEDDYSSWERFVQENKIAKLPMSHVLMDNSVGGIALHSVPKIGDLSVDLWPGLGASWKLLPINQMDQMHSSAGRFEISLLQKHSSTLGNLILAEVKEGWAIGGTVVPNRKGQTFPIHEIEKEVMALPFVNFCVILDFPKYQHTTQFILLIFIKPGDNSAVDKEAKWTEVIQAQIEQTQGPFFIPDQIVYYPLYPRLKNDAIDRSWCRFQYQTGLLQRKKQMKPYHLISSLRMCIKEEMLCQI